MKVVLPLPAMPMHTMATGRVEDGGMTVAAGPSCGVAMVVMWKDKDCVDECQVVVVVGEAPMVVLYPTPLLTESTLLFHWARSCAGCWKLVKSPSKTAEIGKDILDQLAVKMSEVCRTEGRCCFLWRGKSASRTGEICQSDVGACQESESSDHRTRLHLSHSRTYIIRH